MAATAAGSTIQDMVADYFAAVTVKAMLCGSGYVFNKQTHAFRSSVTSEVTGTGYTAGGIALTGVAATLDTVNSRVELTADDANFGTLTVTGITQIVTYVDTGNPATDRIVSVHTFTSESPNGVNFTYAWNDDDANTATDGVIGTFAY